MATIRFRTTAWLCIRSLVAMAALSCVARPVFASTLGNLISQQVSVSNYTHYHQDLLYTYAGDNRGFGPEHDLARANIVSTLQLFGLTVVLEPFVYNSVTYYNVVATQNGTDLPNKTIVVGAHFDSVNNPGADDNATGTALVMEVARVLSQHRSSRRIRYVLFDREEQGRRGSIAYVSAHTADSTLFAVTADMIGHDSGANGMDLYSTNASATITNGVANAISTYGGGLNSFLNFGNFTFSDHWSFESAGIPSLVIIERCYTCNTNYHTQNDATDFSPTYINYNMAGALTRSVTGYLVDNVPMHLWGDADNDADVDGADFLAFRNCFGSPAAPTCYAFDRNIDGTVDCTDWPSFVAAYTASSGAAPLLDVNSFVGVLVGTNVTPVDVCMSDINTDGAVDGRDVQAYVDAALTP